jgi:hypothetical protein
VCRLPPTATDCAHQATDCSPMHPQPHPPLELCELCCLLCLLLGCEWCHIKPKARHLAGGALCSWQGDSTGTLSTASTRLTETTEAAMTLTYSCWSCCTAPFPPCAAAGCSTEQLTSHCSILLCQAGKYQHVAGGCAAHYMSRPTMGASKHVSRRSRCCCCSHQWQVPSPPLHQEHPAYCQLPPCCPCYRTSLSASCMS